MVASRSLPVSASAVARWSGSVGWTSGAVEMDRTIRFAATDWRDGVRFEADASILPAVEAA